MKTAVLTMSVLGFMAQLAVAASNPPPELKPPRKVLTDAELIESLPPKIINKKKDVIYQWVDEKGNTIISDKPHEGAIEIAVPKPQTYKPASHILKEQLTQKELLDSPVQRKIVFSTKPPKVKIVSPVNDSWLDNSLGNAQISVVVNPRLGLGQQLVIKLDNKILSQGAALSTAASGLDRGTHTLTVEVVMRDTGKVILTKQSSFHVRRPFAR